MIKPWEDEKTGKTFCPVNGWDCPYYKNNECVLENPNLDCDDFCYFWKEEIDNLGGC